MSRRELSRLARSARLLNQVTAHSTTPSAISQAATTYSSLARPEAGVTRYRQAMAPTTGRMVGARKWSGLGAVPVGS